jgi:aldose 1-epimerase
MCASGIIQTVSFHGRAVHCLSHGDLEALVDPSHGMNVVSLRYRGVQLLWYDQQRYLAGLTYGSSVLFPTPNRVRDERFVFNGLTYAPMRMHGFAKDSAFSVELSRSDAVSACLSGRFTLSFGHPSFPAFPFPLELTVAVTLSDGSIRWDYRVRNIGSSALGYGFALHPFFVRPSGSSLRLDAPYVMEAGDDKLPTGALLAVSGTSYDLRGGRSVEDATGLDSVFYRSSGSFGCRLSLPDVATIGLSASDEFRHFVVYVPADSQFFCVEPQTSSSDCHNLYARGCRDVSNLLVVPTGEDRCGWVDMAIGAPSRT